MQFSCIDALPSRILLDTVNSLGDNQVGVWAMADQPNEDGCRLWNVGISRAKDYLFIIGNLTYLNNHLTKNSFLRNLLYNAQQKGQVIEVEEILKLDPMSTPSRSNVKLSGIFSLGHFSSTFLLTIFKTPPLFKPGDFS